MDWPEGQLPRKLRTTSPWRDPRSCSHRDVRQRGNRVLTDDEIVTLNRTGWWLTSVCQWVAIALQARRDQGARVMNIKTGACLALVVWGCIRQRGWQYEQQAEMHAADVRAALFITAPAIPNPAARVTKTPSGAWTIASYDTAGLCFAGIYTKINDPINRSLLGGEVSVWADANQPDKDASHSPLSIVELENLAPQTSWCKSTTPRTVRDSTGFVVGTVDQAVLVPCTQYTAQVRVCATNVPLATAKGKYLALAFGKDQAAWRIE